LIKLLDLSYANLKLSGGKTWQRPQETVLSSAPIHCDRLLDIFCSVSGHKKGWVTETMSTLFLAAGAQGVRAYNLRLSDGTGMHQDSPEMSWLKKLTVSPSALREGDSGSWVVDVRLNRVFGHVVAVDDFREAYIIPLEDTFRDIVSTLGVFSLHIAHGAEIMEWRHALAIVHDKIINTEAEEDMSLSFYYSALGMEIEGAATETWGSQPRPFACTFPQCGRAYIRRSDFWYLFPLPLFCFSSIS